jgi:microcompartment protein CcmL/EutN
MNIYYKKANSGAYYTISIRGNVKKVTEVVSDNGEVANSLSDYVMSYHNENFKKAGRIIKVTKEEYFKHKYKNLVL